MTINLADNTPRVSYAVAQGATQTSFTVSFEFFDAEDLNVYVDGTLKTLTSDYTVSGGSGSTGTVTISVTGATGGSTVVITRDIDLKRTTDFPASGAFQVGSLNTELDKLVAIAADLDDKASRALQLTDFDTAVSLVLPDVNTRKGKTLAFNASTGAVEAGPSTSDVQTVSATAADIATLADIEDGTDATDAIQTVAGISSNVSTVAGISGNVTTVAGISSNVTAVAGDATDIGTVATNIANVNTVAGIDSNVTTVAGISANVTTVAGDSADIQAVAADATDIGTVASNIADVNTAAANITAIQNASTNATTATTKAAEASTSATNAATSATNAATSATAAAASQTAAAASAASAASAFDNFDDTYLGSKTSDPTTDNDGDPLTSGDLYFNSTANEMRVYDGANWIAATSAGNVSLILYEYTATAGQTTFSGSDDNSATLSYTADNLQVVMNGIVLDPSDFTATNGTSVVLASGAALNDIVNIYAFKSFTTADMVSASAGGTFSGNVTMTADLTVDTNTLKVDSANNRVGIGTASPAVEAHIQTSSGNPELRIESTGANYATVSVKNSSRHYSTQIRTDQSNAYVVRDETGGANRLLIDTNGNVGIGTSPAKDLHVSGGTDTRIRTEESGGSMIDLTVTNSGHFIDSTSTGDLTVNKIGSANMIFKTANTERMRITSSGEAIMGATSTINSSKFYLKFDRVPNTGMTIENTNGTSATSHIKFQNNNGTVGSVTVSGSSTSFNTSSDHRLKENVVDMTGAIDRVKQLAPKRFNFIADADTTVDGFLAHEAQTVVPEAVHGEHNEVDDDGNAVMQGIDQSKLVPLLTGALQEAIAKIETLETKVAALEDA